MLGVLAGLSLLCGHALAQDTSGAQTPLEMNIGGRTLQRTTGGHPEWAYQWPGIYFESRFKGDAVSLRFDDAASNFNVVVDGRPLKLVQKPGATTLDLTGLGPGAHSVRLEKRSETTSNVGAFAGFFVKSKANALPPQVSGRRIEFIGDSLTVGYGNTSTSIQCTGAQAFETTDTQSAFGPILAKRLNAEYQVNAYSGLGLVRNFANGQWSVGHLPNLLPRILYADDTPAPAWHPQVIVINIGFNDFSPPFVPTETWKTADDLTADYEKTYVDMVKALRRADPAALVIVTWTQYYPPGFAKSSQHILDTLAAQGITNVDHLVYPTLKSTGCDQHPDAQDDIAIAAALETVIAAHPQVWAAR
jgi:lysophospholipase L1-like esterase